MDVLTAPAYAQIPIADKESILAILREYASALQAKDPSRVAELYSPPLKQEHCDTLDAYFRNAKDLTVTIPEDNVQIATSDSGDRALATFSRSDHFTEASTAKPVQLDVRLTFLLEKTDGQWKIKGLKRPT